MEAVTLKKEINWQKVLGSNPCMKNEKIQIFMGSDFQKYITKTKKILVGSEEYIMIHRIDPKAEEILIKTNRSLLVLEVKYNKKTNDLKKNVNYDFYKVIIYFLETFFQKRLQNDKEFNSIKKMLEEYSEISLEISECDL